MKKLSYKYYNKRITIRDDGNVQSHDQEESKLNSTINTYTWQSNKKFYSISIKYQLLKQIKFYQRSYYYALSNRCNGADVMFLFKDGLSLIINRLSFNSSKSFLLSRVRILKSS